VEILRSVDPLLDQEAFRIIYKMPKWIPGKQNGENVPVYFTLPIVFKLAGAEPKAVIEWIEPNAAPTNNLQGYLEKDHPLFVVDGVVMPSSFDLNTISPNGIKEVSVLKGESATKLYGEKAKNGAILITTLKAKE
jgi:TonB-dependent SusC/RagA subfamily outer membrane receptor